MCDIYKEFNIIFIMIIKYINAYTGRYARMDSLCEFNYKLILNLLSKYLVENRKTEILGQKREVCFIIHFIWNEKDKR